MTDANAIVAEVASELRRGGGFTDEIEQKVIAAVRWVESQHTFLFMEQFTTAVELDPDIVDPWLIAAPTLFKKMLSWKIVLDTGKYADIKKVDAYDFTARDVARPKGYFEYVIDGVRFFELDSIPDEVYATRMAYVARTDVSSFSTDQAIYDECRQILVAHSLYLLGSLLRDEKIMKINKELRDDAMKAAIDADVEERNSGQSESVQYGRDVLPIEE